MSYKVFLRRFMVLSVSPFIFILLFNYVVDPLQFYRAAEFYPAYYSMEQRFQNPGLVRSLDYDTIIVGTSMSENFVPSYVNEAMGVKTVKLAMSAGSAREQYLITDLALRSGKVRNVIWEINFDSLVGDPELVREQFGAFPYYLYDENPVTDINYLINKGTTELSYDILAALYGRKEIPQRSLERLNNWHKQVTYGVDEVKKVWDEQQRTPVAINREAHVSDMKANIDKNIYQLAEKYEGVNFYLYFPPFSVLKHRTYNERNVELFEANLEIKRYVVEKFAGLEHVKIHDFQQDENITFDLAYYKDPSHYGEEINEIMVDALASGEYLVDESNVEELVNRLRDQVVDLNVSGLWK